MSLQRNYGLKRNNNEKFYTKPNIVQDCINQLSLYIDINFNNDCIIEPSAGNGSFISSLNEKCNNCYFYDILPENDKIIQQDFLKLNNDIFIKYNKIHIIGNPPFGRQSHLAIKFIKKSCLFCDTISFILPKSFKKQSMKNYFDDFFHLVFEYDIPPNSFEIDKKNYNVNCVFQIWVKKSFKRPKIKKKNPIGYIFVKNKDNADISFRRVGVNAGCISTETKNKSSQSHYFIKFDRPISQSKYLELCNINYECKNNTVGPKSISKQELIEKFNEIL